MSIANTKAHFIGVGGVGMSALALLFRKLGAEVSGSDIREGKNIAELRNNDISVALKQVAANVTNDLDVVVYSSAIKPDNPELIQAREMGIPIIPRAEALAEIMRYKKGIAVGGTHGKTTTTSLISAIFLHAKYDPTIAVGGRLKLIESTARLGEGPWMVAEADESDGSFSRLKPEVAIITNIDADHLDHFGNFTNLQKAFLGFALNIPYYGSAIVYGDDLKTRELFKNYSKKVFFYGEKSDNDYILKKEGKTYQVWTPTECVGDLNLQVPGRHNALNALAACIATHQAGVDWPTALAGAARYSGVDRRFQNLGQENGVSVFDDYAHHPTEIKATIQAVRELEIAGQFHLLYQPHRFTRTRDCWQEYKDAFLGVDQLHLVDIYPAGESPIDGVDSDSLSQFVDVPAYYHAGFDEALAHLADQVRPGDFVMTMGAGNISQLGPELLASLKEKS